MQERSLSGRLLIIQVRLWLGITVSGAGLARKPTHGGSLMCTQQCWGRDRVSGVVHSLAASSTGKGGFCNEYNVVASKL